MNFKPSPLTEASLVLAISTLGIFLTFTITGGGVNAGFTMLTNSAMTFLLPAFTFWATIGLFVRQKSTMFRMLTNIAVSSVVTAVLSNIFISAVADSTIGTDSSRQSAQALVAGMAIVTFLSALVGALITFLWLVRRRAVKP